jgi:hypothetical protein
MSVVTEQMIGRPADFHMVQTDTRPARPDSHRPISVAVLPGGEPPVAVAVAVAPAVGLDRKPFTRSPRMVPPDQLPPHLSFLRDFLPEGGIPQRAPEYSLARIITEVSEAMPPQPTDHDRTNVVLSVLERERRLPAGDPKLLTTKDIAVDGRGTTLATEFPDTIDTLLAHRLPKPTKDQLPDIPVTRYTGTLEPSEPTIADPERLFVETLASTKALLGPTETRTRIGEIVDQVVEDPRRALHGSVELILLEMKFREQTLQRELAEAKQAYQARQERAQQEQMGVAVQEEDTPVETVVWQPEHNPFGTGGYQTYIDKGMTDYTGKPPATLD